MTNETIPEPDPVIDRMVAEVVGWEWFEYLDGRVGGWVELDRKPSTSPAAATAALVATREGT